MKPSELVPEIKRVLTSDGLLAIFPSIDIEENQEITRYLKQNLTFIGNPATCSLWSTKQPFLTTKT